jgi:hypothetical protein
MNISKIIATGALATSLAFAQDDDVWPGDIPDEEQATEQAEEEPQETAQEVAQDEPEESVREEAEPAKPQRRVRNNTQANNQRESYNQEPAQVAVQDNSYNEQPKSAPKSEFGVGIRGAFNYNMMYGLGEEWYIYNDSENDIAPSGIGFEVGLGIRLQLLPFMQFTPEVLFEYAKLSQEDGSMERTFKQMSVEFPLLLRVTPIEKVYFVVGPSIELNVSDETKLESGVMENAAGKFEHDFPEEMNRKSVQFGITVGGGYYIVGGLSVDFRFNWGMTDVYEGYILSEETELTSGKLNTFKFGIGYWFM